MLYRVFFLFMVWTASQLFLYIIIMIIIIIIIIIILLLLQNCMSMHTSSIGDKCMPRLRRGTGYITHNDYMPGITASRRMDRQYIQHTYTNTTHTYTHTHTHTYHTNTRAQTITKQKTVTPTHVSHTHTHIHTHTHNSCTHDSTGMLTYDECSRQRKR